MVSIRRCSGNGDVRFSPTSQVGPRVECFLLLGEPGSTGFVTEARFYSRSCTTSHHSRCWTATVSSHLEFDGLIHGVDKGCYLDKHARKGAVKLARKGAGIYKPVSPPGSAWCSHSLRGPWQIKVRSVQRVACMCGLYYLCTTQTTRRHSRSPPRTHARVGQAAGPPSPTPQQSMKVRHDGRTDAR